jgi:ABC-2 type transport system ATP-binding protein
MQEPSVAGAHRGPALVADGLTKRYDRGTLALSDVTMEIGWGRITALVGPNAAGKSTLIKTWVGFERPTQGRVSVGGIDPWSHRAEAVALIAYLPQVPALYPELSAAEHVELAHHYRSGLDRVEALSRLTNLGVPLDRRAKALSGGQMAQLGLAIALATHAPILLLDEPMASLDPLARREFIDALRDGVREAGVSAVLSSHVVSDIEQAADWLVVLGVGRKLLDMSINEATSQHRVTESYEPTVGRGEVIARLPGQIGSLVRAEPGSIGGRVASLDDVVMGYLSMDRVSRPRESIPMSVAE